MIRRVPWLPWLGLLACRTPEPALAPDTTKLIEFTFASSLPGVVAYNLDIYDMVREGDLVVMTIYFGSTLFLEHPTYCTGECEGTSSSASGGTFHLAVSRDGGTSFTTTPLRAAEGVSGEPLGVHLSDGQAWILLARNPGYGAGYAKYLHPLDLSTATIGPAMPGVEFSVMATSFAFTPGYVTSYVTGAGDLDRLDGYFGFQQVTLATGGFTDEVASVRFDGCRGPLYFASTPDGATWSGHDQCVLGGVESWCLYEPAGSAAPKRTCIPRLAWPGPYEPPAQLETGAGVMALYMRDDAPRAARLDPATGQVREVALGDGLLTTDLRPMPRVRMPFGALIPTGAGLDQGLIALSPEGVPSEVSLPLTPCVDDAACMRGPHEGRATERNWALPIGDDTYLLVYQMDVGKTDAVMGVFVRKARAATTSTDPGPTEDSPIPGCASAVPASPLVEACAHAVACFPALDLHTCLDDWATTTHLGPTAATRDEFLTKASWDCSWMAQIYPKAGLGYLPTCTPGCYANALTVRCSTDASPHEIIDCEAQGGTCASGPTGAACTVQPEVCATCDACEDAGLACVDDRATCDNRSICADDQQIRCDAVVDCDALGLPCSEDAARGGFCGTCASTGACPDRQTCPTQGCFGAYMLVDLDREERAWVDCTALGYQTCADPYGGHPVCVR